MNNDNHTYEEKVQSFIDLWNSDTPYIEACTSGSTGIPKKIRLPRQLIKESAQRSIRHFGLNSHSVIHLILSPDYIAGKMAIVRALESGCTLTYEKPSSVPLSDTTTPPHITLLSAVGAQIDGLFLLHKQGRLPHIKHLLLGGSPLTNDMRTKAVQLASHTWESYGMTETASHIALRLVDKENPTVTSPFIPLDNITVDTDSRGCLVINMPANSLQPEYSLTTNDIATISSTGGFQILGRIDNVIISGGIKVIPEVVEHKLGELLGNRAYYIASLPHPKWGEEVILIVETSESNTEQWIDLHEYPEDSLINSIVNTPLLSAAERPKRVLLTPHIARTSSGKIIRKHFLNNKLT